MPKARKGSAGRWLVAWLLLCSPLVIVAAMYGSGSSTLTSPPKPLFLVGDRLRLDQEAWACDKAARDELSKQHDREAFMTLMHRFRIAGRCFPVQSGTVIDVMAVALFDGETAVRIKGKPEDWWMSTSVLAESAAKIGKWQP